MEIITLKVPNKKSRSFLLKILEHFDFVTVVNEDAFEKNEVLDNIKEGFREAKLMHEEKIPARPFEDFLNEL